MKFSNYIGIGAAIVLIGCCFLPWVYIDPIKTVITGVKAENTGFGKPGALHIFFSIVSIVFFLVPTIWAKRSNLFVGALNFAWSIRNFLVVTQCELGECPQKMFGIYAVVAVSAIFFLMTLLPDLRVKSE